MSLTLIKKTGLFDTFLLKYLCAHTKSCTFAPEKEKRIIMVMFGIMTVAVVAFAVVACAGMNLGMNCGK